MLNLQLTTLDLPYTTPRGCTLFDGVHNADIQGIRLSRILLAARHYKANLVR